MKRRVPSMLLVLVLVLVLAVGVIAVGCGEEEETATTGGTDETTATTTEETEFTGEPIKLTYQDQNAETGWVGVEAANPWLDMVEEATGGRVEIERYFGGTLSPPPQAYESLKAGTMDMSWLLFQYWAGLVPLAEVVTLPFMPFESAEQASEIVWTLYEEFPSVAEQFAETTPIVLWNSTPYFLATTEKAVRTPADIAGLKIRAVGGPPTTLVEALGGVAVGMPMPDVYQALQTGTLDGVLTNWESWYSFRHYELCPYLTMVPFHTGLFGVDFNNDSWAGLPADIQDDIMSVGGVTGSKFWGANMFDSTAEQVPLIAEEEGFDVEYIEFTDDELLTMWEKPFGEPAWALWVTAMEAEGYTDAQAILDRCLELIDEI